VSSFAVIVLALSVVPASASDLSLRIVDAKTLTGLPDAVVSHEGRDFNADREGRLVLPLELGRVSLRVRAPGYAERTVDIEMDSARSLEVELVPRDAFRERVDVLAGSAGEKSPTTTLVSPSEVTQVAGGGENVFRVLQTLPGVASPEDFSSRISVRGGGPDENLTVMDGVEIHNPYRLFGLVSAFNPETVESFELTAGGFGAAHGDRLSSLLVVHNRPGTSERVLTGSAALSLTDTNLILEGRLPRGTGSWLVTGRRTYYDLVAERFTDQDLPSFNDLQGKSVFRLGGGRTLSLFSLRSREATDASFDDPDEGAKGAVFTRTRNDLVAATFEATLGSRGMSRTILSGYTNTDSVDFGADFRDDTRRSNAPGLEALDTSRIAVTWDGTVRDFALRQEATLRASSRHVLEAGTELHRLRTRVRFTIPGERNPNEANSSSLAGGAGLPDDLDSSRNDTRGGAWLQDRFSVSSRFALDAGLRLDHSSVNGRTELQPRFGATFAITPRTRLRGSLGFYTQSPGYEKLVQSDYFVDLTAPGKLALDNEQARHALLSVERDLPGDVLLRTAAYYKRFDRMIVGRLETPAETAARTAEYDFPATLQDSVPREPFITTFPTNGARGRAYGFDVYVARPARSSTRLTGWASYTYGVATREAYGRTFPFDYDRRHAFTLVGNLRLGAKFALSTTARLASGFPRTPVRGLRVAATADRFDRDGDGNREELVPDRDRDGVLIYTTDLGGLANLNTARLPHYERVDARLTFLPRGTNGRLKLYVDVINVLNRKNAGLLTPKLEYDPGSDRPRLVEEADGSLPFLPSFGIHVDFGRLPRGAP
jgi:hypothetical protein